MSVEGDGRWITSNGAHIFIHGSADSRTPLAKIVAGMKARLDARNNPPPPPKPSLGADHPLVQAAHAADKAVAENQKITMHSRLVSQAQMAHINVINAAKAIGDTETEARHQDLRTAAINAKFNGPAKAAFLTRAQPREVKADPEEDAQAAVKYLSDHTAESRDLADRYFASMKQATPTDMKVSSSTDPALKTAVGIARELGDYVPAKYADRSVGISRGDREGNVMGSYNDRSQTITLTPGAMKDRDTVTHEMGHHLEDHNPAIGRAARELYRQKTAGKTPMTAQEKAQAGYGGASYTLHKGFVTPYASRVYGTGHTELVSVGIEAWRKNPVAFSKKDPAHFAFIHKIMKGAF